jgi:chromosome segregation protein
LLRGKHTGACQRLKVLEELEGQNVGLSAGVQEVLAQGREDGDEDDQQIHGMVADLIEAGVEIAPLIDVALGDAAQHIVVSGNRLLHRIRSGEFKPSGRVGIVCLDTLTSATAPLLPSSRLAGRTELQGRPGVIGRADRLVSTDERFGPLIQHLLARTWLVENLSAALTLSRLAGRGLRFVTPRNELLESDGTLVVGPPTTTIGLVSRRSELRALRQETVDLGRRINQFVDETAQLRENIDRQERRNKRLGDAYRSISAALADQRVRRRTLQERHDQLGKEREAAAAELEVAQADYKAAVDKLDGARKRLSATETSIANLEADIQADNQRIEELEVQLAERTREATAAKVELAKSEQRLDGLRTQKKQFETDRRERERTIQDAKSQLEHSLRRHRETELHILQTTSELAALYLRKEALARDVLEEVEHRQALNARRTELADEREQIRRRIHRFEQQQHKLDLDARELQHDRNALAERLRDDYGIEIAEMAREVSDEEEEQRAQTEAEIADLRNKINRIGAVNLDALDELDELDERFGSLSGQFQDLTQAKESLERIIHKINADSRRLFTETLEAVRANFQVLYRRAFGGGHADIAMEEGKDVLDCGVDIVANPPGKPSFSNSLLSGGEKAMTAVALLLAIFQFRPSPFCILDEVDAPFDEANIDRFISVLTDFLTSSKFVIVTHSKKTMTAADTIYGVTMQESGVSKRVSVRFEDVSEDGHISDEALRREEASQQDDERAA